MEKSLIIIFCLMTILMPLIVGNNRLQYYSNSKVQRKEIFIFSTTNKNYRHYDWNKVTTVVQCGYHDPDLVKFAHSKNASVVSLGNFNGSILYQREKIDAWVEEKVKYTVNKGLDGINVDYEGEMICNDISARQGYNYLMSHLKHRLKEVLPQSQVTVDFAWSPGNIDNRCYDYKALGEIVDFSFLMMYNLRSQVFLDSPCLAWANAAYNGTVDGLNEFLSLGLDSSKLVMGVPWFGFDYKCESYNIEKDECVIKEVPFRGCNCSDAGGAYVGYSDVRNTLRNVKLIEPHVMIEPIALSPYFSYKILGLKGLKASLYQSYANVKQKQHSAEDGKYHQVWYDDDYSLKYRYDLALKKNLRGVGMWEADHLNYTGSTEDQEDAKKMWAGLPTYK